MALVLIKEDGTAKTDANTYAVLADATAYFEAHLYASSWNAASSANKEAALAMATRLIDAQYQFRGRKVSDTQALQWPRQNCADPDAEEGKVAEDSIPKALVQATCEMARELVIADRTGAVPGEGLKYYNVGTTQTGYSKTDVRPIISHVTQGMLAKYGVLIGKGGSVPLTRV